MTIKRDGEHWYACFSCEIEQDTLPVAIQSEVGIDVGLEKFATLSNGDTIANPRWFRMSADKLTAKQQQLSRCVRGSHHRNQVRKQVAALHSKVANQRRDFQHKLSHRLVAEYDAIYVEDLAIKNMVRAPKAKQNEDGEYLPNGAAAKAGLDRSISDAGWGTFLQMLTYKAENAGKLKLAVRAEMKTFKAHGYSHLFPRT